VCRHRLAPPHFSRALLLAESYDPQGALQAGFLDRVVPTGQLLETARSVATELAKLDMKAHADTKERARAQLLRDMRTVSRTDFRDYVVQGARLYLQHKLGGAKGA
jgi:enoyl-CoA hydratase